MITVHGYRYSVYTRAIWLALAERRLDFTAVEMDPFEDPLPGYDKLHPFGRVPTLVHEDFVLYETTAILCYLDEAFPGEALQPVDVRPRARMRQIISIGDSYGYWPMVRQVYARRVFGPSNGEMSDETAVAEGLERAGTVLAALEALADAGGFLVGDRLTLADLHLAPMFDAFAAAPEGKAMLADHQRLALWYDTMRQRASMRETEGMLLRSGHPHLALRLRPA